MPLAHRILRPVAPTRYETLYKKYCQEIVALENVSFTLDRGDSLGIIGLNGSGKSTLLQIIAGTLSASAGEVETRGRIAALLELGSGFDPEFTGKENVYLNAAILGLTEQEVDARYDSIVSFADIGDAIDHPVKTYSSGMMVRLAFAVQVHVEPEILIVDEALAVGDARFQAKALSKLDTILADGTTLLFVGHDLNTVKAFCRQAVLLDRGRVIAQGLSDDVVAEYLLLAQKNQNKDGGASVSSVPRGFSSDGYQVTSAKIAGYGEHADIAYGTEISIDLEVSLGSTASAPYMIFDVVDPRGLQLTGQRIPIPTEVREASEGNLSIRLTCSFQQGLYRCRFRIVDAPSLAESRMMSRQDGLISIYMLDDVREKFTGIFHVPLHCEWS